MPSIGTPQDSMAETQEAAKNFDLVMTIAVDEDLPSKHLRFLSFQMAQIIAEERHKSLL